MAEWIETTNRFIAFFDIMGFKDLVQKGTHEEVLRKLNILKKTLNYLNNKDAIHAIEHYSIDLDQTKAITFSDSIIIFSKSDSYNDALKILIDANAILRDALNNSIAIKGAISYGKITVDFNKSLFFGQPIIDAYLLHDELHMLSVIIDHNFEIKITPYIDDPLYFVIADYRANLKSGKITHKIMKPSAQNEITERISSLDNLYHSVSGKPRAYIDNTIDFLKSLQITD